MEKTDFERVSGEFEHEGEFYTLVKQRFEHDTLFVVCIKNHERKEIKKALSDYVKTFTDEPAAGHQGKTIPSFIKDFLPSEISLEPLVAGWTIAFHFGQFTASPASQYLTITSPPPRV
jgi:hypothetical protein